MRVEFLARKLPNITIKVKLLTKAEKNIRISDTIPSAVKIAVPRL